MNEETETKPQKETQEKKRVDCEVCKKSYMMSHIERHFESKAHKYKEKQKNLTPLST